MRKKVSNDVQEFLDTAAKAAKDFGDSIGKSFSEGILSQARVFGFSMADMAFGLKTGHYVRDDADWLREHAIESFRTRLIGFAEVARSFMEKLVNAVLSALSVLVNKVVGFALL